MNAVHYTCNHAPDNPTVQPDATAKLALVTGKSRGRSGEVSSSSNRPLHKHKAAPQVRLPYHTKPSLPNHARSLKKPSSPTIMGSRRSPRTLKMLLPRSGSAWHCILPGGTNADGKQGSFLGQTTCGGRQGKVCGVETLPLISY